MSRVRTIAPPEAHAGPTFVPRRITKHLGRGMERHAAGTARRVRTCIHFVMHWLPGQACPPYWGQARDTQLESVAAIVAVVVRRMRQPFLPSSSSEAHRVFTRPLGHFGPYSPATRTLEPGRQFARRLTRTGGLKRVVLAACHRVTPTCRSRCGPIGLSNTLSTIVTPSRTFVATWFKPLSAYTWLPAIDVAGT
jgi:hypothetical protein